MTQNNAKAREFGWGWLKVCVEDMQENFEILLEKQKQVEEDQQKLRRSISNINTKRRSRVLDLLRIEGKAICLTHSLVFQGNSVTESLVSVADVVVVQMYMSWTTERGYGDSDRTIYHHSKSYETVVCKLCQSVLSHTSVEDIDHTTHGMILSQVPSNKTHEEFYSSLVIIDLISAEYFQMPVVTLDNIQSLQV